MNDVGLAEPDSQTLREFWNYYEESCSVQMFGTVDEAVKALVKRVQYNQLPAHRVVQEFTHDQILTLIEGDNP